MGPRFWSLLVSGKMFEAVRTIPQIAEESNLLCELSSVCGGRQFDAEHAILAAYSYNLEYESACDR